MGLLLGIGGSRGEAADSGTVFYGTGTGYWWEQGVRQQ